MTARTTPSKFGAPSRRPFKSNHEGNIFGPEMEACKLQVTTFSPD
jgi:hypothetical protein